ncbi:MAG: hypothetical protein MK213_09250 [Planctomycetes bacterium]|nr:hypothetical protein [Planctomycetota bacterium]
MNSRLVKSLNQTQARSSERGAVFLFALLLTSIMASLATSFGSSVRTQLNVAHHASQELQADLAAQSGLEYALRRLSLEPGWTGTPQGGWDVGGMTLEVDCTHQGNQTTVVVDGVSEEGRAQLTADLASSSGMALGNKACILLGSEFDITSAQIVGDIIIPDQLGVVQDWVNDAQGNGMWVPGGSSTLGPMWFQWAQVTGELSKYTNNQYIPWANNEVVVSDGIRMPSWNLNDYLIPAAGVTIFQDVNHISQTVVHDLAVFVLDPGETLTIEQCQMLGGVIVWCEPDYDLRSEPRNEVYFTSCQIGRGTPNDPVGLIAPAAKVTTDPNSGGGQVHGFSFWGSGEGIRSVLIQGQLVVVNRLTDFANAQIVFKPSLEGNEPDGIDIVDSSGSLELLQIRESFN